MSVPDPTHRPRPRKKARPGSARPSDHENRRGRTQVWDAAAARAYPFRLTTYLSRRLPLEDPAHPLCRQFLPDRAELDDAGPPDPLDEERFRVGPGLVRRFADRLLALVAADCPIHCRHCNRKRRWGASPDVATPAALARAVRRLPGVREVILSGGEPLSLSDARLAQFLCAARARPGIEIVRVHTRMPLATPARITPALVRLLGRHQPLWLVTHFNHECELFPEVRAALRRLLEGGIPLLNQAVLLRGVNDSAGALRALGEALVSCGVKPYYLFSLDRARGTTHFQVPLGRARRIVRELRASASGLCLPQFVADLPGAGGKVPLEPDALVRRTRRGAMLRGRDGRSRLYPDPA